MMSNSNNRKYLCEICSKVYTFKHNLYRHINVTHPSVHIEMEKKNLKCPICDYTPKSSNKLSEHLILIHNVKLEMEEHEFKTESEFSQWKSSLESENFANFIKVRGDKRIKDGSCVTYYKCHRSGKFISKSNGIRRLKSQGSNKINGICPANIKFIKTKQGKIFVQYQKTHVGHQNDIGHLPLTAQDREKLAQKIASNISLDVILDEVRNSLSDTKIERIHLLTRKDLHNIEKRYNLNAPTTTTTTTTSNNKQQNDTSIEDWVKEMQKTDNSCIIHYKPEGLFDEKYGELQLNDFILILMNEAQSEMLKKYGNNYICIDRTRELNAYEYEMFSLMVLDEIQQGFPCAFLITNRFDPTILTLFFALIQDKIGVITTTIFTSDIEETFYNSWTQIMGTTKYQFYCQWHIDEEWKSNLNRIKNLEKQSEIYLILKKLIEETDITNFQIILAKFIKDLFNDEETLDFGVYFTTNYANNYQNWANCYQLINSSLITTNNTHLEKLHRTIKYIYMQGRNIKRLDKSIHAIMQFVRDKLIDRLIIVNQSKMRIQLKQIEIRHRKSLLMFRDNVIVDGNDWKVASASGKELYTIQEICTECCNNCQFICKDCLTCIHRYTCSCVDSAIKWNMCKHIHLICQIKLENQQLNTNRIDFINVEIEQEEINEAIATDEREEEESTAGRGREEEESTIGRGREEEEEESVAGRREEEGNPIKTFGEAKEELKMEFDNILDMIKTKEHIENVKKLIIQPIVATLTSTNFTTTNNNSYCNDGEKEIKIIPSIVIHKF